MIRVRRQAADFAVFTDLDQHVGYMLRRAQLAVFANFSDTQRGVLVRPGQLMILDVIGRNPGLSQSQLCDVVGIKRANLVGMIDQMEALDLVRRAQSVSDRRSNQLQLTPGGRRALQTALEDQTKHEAEIARLLGPAGRLALLRQLAKLCELGH